MTDISNTDNVIDSRDVIARIEELEDELEGGTLDEDGGYVVADNDGDLIDMDDEHEELTTLRELVEELRNCYSDWPDSATLISENYFERYAEDFASEIGAISSEHQWPLGCIDWKKAADELKQDYSSVDFDGITFWVRQ